MLWAPWNGGPGALAYEGWVAPQWFPCPPSLPLSCQPGPGPEGRTYITFRGHEFAGRLSGRARPWAAEECARAGLLCPQAGFPALCISLVSAPVWEGDTNLPRHKGHADIRGHPGQSLPGSSLPRPGCLRPTQEAASPPPLQPALGPVLTRSGVLAAPAA